jgi:hypothetical protein
MKERVVAQQKADDALRARDERRRGMGQHWREIEAGEHGNGGGDAAESKLGKVDVKELSVDELKERLEELGLPTTGLKQVLEERLEKRLEQALMPFGGSDRHQEAADDDAATNDGTPSSESKTGDASTAMVTMTGNAPATEAEAAEAAFEALHGFASLERRLVMAKEKRDVEQQQLLQRQENEEASLDNAAEEEWKRKKEAVAAKEAAKRALVTHRAILDTVHIGTWHVPPGACEYLPCGVSPGLRRALKGQPHWSCCLLVDYDAPCPKARGRGCRRDHDTCNKSVTCFSSILYDRVERAIEAEEEAHVVLTAAFKGGDPTTILTSDAALKAAEASLQEARDTLADQAPGGDSAYK